MSTALQTQVGQFTAPTTVGSLNVPCNFPAKAIIFWNHGKTANAESAGASFSMGFSDLSHIEVNSWAADDAVTTQNVGQRNANSGASAILTDGTPTVGTGSSIASVTLNSGSFTVNFNTVPAQAWLYNFILLGGSDISNVFVGTTSLPRSTGNFSITNVGFSGDFVLMLLDGLTAPGNAVDAGFCVGAAVSSTKRWGFCVAGRDAQTSGAFAKSIMRSDRCLESMNSADTVNLTADFVGFSANGFDISVSVAPASNSLLLCYLVIKGGQWDVGTSAKPTTAAAQVVTGETFQPSLLALLDTSATSSNSATAPNALSFGATDGTNQIYSNVSYSDAAYPVTATSRGASAALLIDRDGSNNPEATFGSFNSDGWTINWDNTGSARLCGWFTCTGFPISTATTPQPYLGIGSKDYAPLVGSFDMGAPAILYGVFDDDFVTKFDGTVVNPNAANIASVPWGVFDRRATLAGLYGAI